MNYIRKEDGVGQLLIVGLVAVVVVLVGFAILQSQQSSKQNAKMSNSPTATTDAKLTSTPRADPTANWTVFAAELGKYSLRYNPQWKSKYCNSADMDNLQLETSAEMLVQCGGGENAHVRVQMTAEIGNNLAGADVAEAGFTGSKVSVTIDGAQGHRYEGTKTEHTPIDYPPVGTKYIKYVLATNGKTYQFRYYQHPGDVDLSSDFEQMIKGTLKFSN